jgi:ABC-type oligopeptide transport system ATPase subunit
MLPRMTLAAGWRRRAMAPIVELQSVSKTFEARRWIVRRASVRAVEEVSLSVRPGETLGIVGESGSGKSTLTRLILRLIRPTSGEIRVAGRDIGRLPQHEMRGLRRQMQAVFQDPTSSFNPRQTVLNAVVAPLEVHRVGAGQRRDLAAEALALVGLNTSFFDRYPHQLSGGQRQRVSIARAIILRPALVIADEPTSALDVSVQAQILNLFRAMKRELGLTYIFVSHNLGVIRYVSDRVAVMYKGRIVEMGDVGSIFASPQHEYTRELLDAVPEFDLPQ